MPQDALKLSWGTNQAVTTLHQDSKFIWNTFPILNIIDSSGLFAENQSFLFNKSGTICSLMIWYQIKRTTQHSFGTLSTNYILTHEVMKYRPQQVYIHSAIRKY